MVQNTNDRGPRVRRSKIDDVAFNAAPPAAGSDIGTTLRLLRCLGQICAGGLDEVGVAQGLRQTPLRHGIVKHSAKVALRPWTEPVFSHAERSCAA